MIAEHTLALLIVVFCGGFLVGDWIRFRRSDREVRRWYIGSLRDW